MASNKVSKTAKRSTPKSVARTDEQALVQAAISADTNLMYPIQGAVAAYVRNPIKGTTTHVLTDSDRFVEIIAELTSLGLGVRIERELTEFATKYSDRWSDVHAKLTAAGVFTSGE